MEISYTTTYNDYIQANRLACKLSPAIKITLLSRAMLSALGAAVLTVGGSAVINGGESPRMGIVLLTGGVLLFVVLMLTPIAVRHAMYAWNPMHGVLLTATIGDDGVSVASPTTRLWYAWGAFVDSREGSRCLVLRLSPQLYVWFPKRDLSPEQLNEFRSLVASKIRPKS